jgi:hypothetical protein
MKKTIRLTEEQLLGIIERVISEQSNTPACNSWVDGTFKQGDGIKTPKITITKTPSLVEGLYEGPDAAGCIQRLTVDNGDTPHQLAGILVYNETAPYLKELYRNKTYVKPDMNNITMERVKNKSFKISIPLLSTTEDKAITNMNRRGGMDHAGETAYIDRLANDPNHALVEIVTKKAGDMTEKFICFRNIKDFPIKTTPSNEETKQEEPQFIEINATDLNDLNKLEQMFTIINQKEKYKLTDIKIWSVSPNKTDVNISYNKVKDPNGNTGFFLFFTPKVATKSELQEYNDTFLEKMNLAQQSKIIDRGTLNWVGNEFNYVIVGHN